MSINLVNPETIVGKIDAAGNFVAQIRLALMVGDKERAMFAVEEAERHISDALMQAEELPPPSPDWKLEAENRVDIS